MAVQGISCHTDYQTCQCECPSDYWPQLTCQAAKESSGSLMELVIPLIEESLQPPAKDFFEEDGIEL